MDKDHDRGMVNKVCDGDMAKVKARHLPQKQRSMVGMIAQIVKTKQKYLYCIPLLNNTTDIETLIEKWIPA